MSDSPAFSHRRSPGFASEWLGCATLAAVSLLAAQAPAAGLYQDGAGGRAAGMGGTGVVVNDDPLGALFNNPAALSDLSRLAVELGVEGAFVQGRFQNRANPRVDLNDAGALGGLAVAAPAGPFHFGLGINPDIALRGDWRYRDTPGGADGLTSYGVRTHRSEILLLRSAAGASWTVTPTLSLGANVGLLYNQNRLHAPYVFQTQRTLRTVKTLLDLQTDGFGWNAQAGLRWRPLPALTFGLSYTSPARVETDGEASGNAGVQLGNLGLGGARPDFRYDATVINHFPQQVSAGVAWQGPRRLTLSAQFDWINWADAFDTLPVRLRGGNNADLNGLVGSNRLNDDIPLNWRDQFVGRFGVEQGVGENWTLRAGYAYGNNPVPAATLSPLTAAITEHTLTAGLGFHRGRVSVDVAYQWELPATGRVRQSELAAGEYSNSTTRISVQEVAVRTTVAF